MPFSKIVSAAGYNAVAGLVDKKTAYNEAVMFLFRVVLRQRIDQCDQLSRGNLLNLIGCKAVGSIGG